MTNTKPIRFEDIEHFPARELMMLSYAQLNEFIREAHQISRNAQAVANWLETIKRQKAEKSSVKGAFEGGTQ